MDKRRPLLIVEDDPHYARILLGIARTKGFKGLVANRGQQALSLARAGASEEERANVDLAEIARSAPACREAMVG